MVLIRIEERARNRQTSEAVVSFDHGPHYLVKVTDPFTTQQEQDLAWYFEEHLFAPFLKEVRAREAAASVTAYGEALFRQIFLTNPDLYATYKRYADSGLETLNFEIAGSPAFHALHWEALKDPKLPHPFVLDAALVHKNLTPVPFEAIIRPTSVIHVLVVTARPYGRQDVGYRTISLPLVETLRQTQLRVQIDLVRPGTYDALERTLRAATDQYGKGYYQVIHFDVHGAVLTYEQLTEERAANRLLFQKRSGIDRPDIVPYQGERAFLFLETAQIGQADPVEASELAKLLLAHQIPVAILNACQSAKVPYAGDEEREPQEQQQASSTQWPGVTGDQRESSLALHLMQAGVQTVLAMGYSITVSAARSLMHALYRQLFAAQDFATALRTARLELASHKARQAAFNMRIDLEDWLLPVLYQNNAVNLQMSAFTPEEDRQYHEQRVASYREPETGYGFVGRDLDVLEIERRLLLSHAGQASTIQLVRGMGGVGKTTLLRHLGAWWQTTHLVEQVFYFGYDERAWSCQQLIRQIATRLVGKERFTHEYQPLSLAAQQEKLTALLRATRHLLILDNLESITGSHQAIRHTLRPKEQEALLHLLADLVGGQTLVLLGSRGDEAWLAPGTFENNRYELAGLDPEAASQLTERILDQHQATQYRQDANLRRLLTVLDGFPLALEVVLPNLARQTPTEILAALQAGDVSLDRSGDDEKIDGILHCINYSYGNLSPEAQNLLLCLTPFTALINSKLLEEYTRHLRNQSVLADLHFERWSEVLREAQNWGLLTPDASLPDNILHLHPVLPYFLQTRLRDPKRQLRREAIESAFRQYYETVGIGLFKFLTSNQPNERFRGQFWIEQEYENLYTALRLALAAREPVHKLQRVLDEYLDQMQEHSRGLELALLVWDSLQNYPEEVQKGKQGGDFVASLASLAESHRALKQYEQAEQMYEQALELLKNTVFDKQNRETMSAGVYRQLGLIAQEQQKWEKAEKSYQQALQIYIESQDHANQAEVYENLGMVDQKQGRWEKAEKSYQQALDIFTASQNRYRQASTYHNLGTMAQELNQWEKAESYYQRALQIKIESQDRYRQASTYHNLGLVAQELNQWEKAEACYQQALQIYIEFQDRYGQARTYRSLGSVAQEQRQWEEAENYYQQALHIFIEFQDLFEQASTYHDLGEVTQKQRKWETAERYYRQALQTYVYLQDRDKQASMYSNLGGVAQEQQQWKEAENYYQQALQICIESQNRYEQAMTCFRLADCAQKQQQWKKAENSYQQALQIFDELGERYVQSDIYHNLGVVAEGQRQWEKAKSYYQQALQIYDEFQNRYDPADTYHQLGKIAQEQQQWGEAENYYLQALKIYNEFQNYQAQAGTYFLLGTLAKILQQWEKASGYLMEALEGFAAYGEIDAISMTFFHLAQIWKEHNQKDLAAQVASRLKMTKETVEQVFARFVGNDDKSKTP